MSKTIILKKTPLGPQWPVRNPFIFCAHHLDLYPAGNERMEPATSLEGRNIGSDFTPKDGWRMYHGDKVPGFPVHPHRGFETITIVKTGFVDHSDSHGQAGRYGEGDVQWMTAGSGLQHSEMFPLLNENGENHTELFQVWLNLPKARKFVEPHFKMLWSEDIPKVTTLNGVNNVAEIDIVAGEFDGKRAPDPAPDSWAAFPENEVMMLTIKLKNQARFRISPANPGVVRTLYFYRGSSILVNGTEINAGFAIEVIPDAEIEITGVSDENLIVLLQGMPVNEPVIQYGPFVMNTKEEIFKAFEDYRETEFGGWPWPRPDNVHPKGRGRFAKYKDHEESRN